MTVLFSLVLGVLVLCAVCIVRAALRRRQSYRSILEKTTQLSPNARKALTAARQNQPFPETWLGVTDLIRIKRNTTIYARLAGIFYRVILRCKDDATIRRLAERHLSFTVAKSKLDPNLRNALVGSCLGTRNSGKFRECVTQTVLHYGEIVEVQLDMAEVMDDSCVPLLEGQYFHGS